jgi:phosphatidylinositol alpha-mannosyltransferase
MRQVEDMGIPDVVFAGAVRAADLPRYYATCDVYCAPSTGRESFGIVLLEALATGAPVVASNIPGYAGVIRHAQTGMLTTPEDSLDIAMSIVRILADEALRTNMIAEGLRDVQQYGWPVIARQVLEVYERGLARERPSRSAATLPAVLLERARG